MTAVRDCAETMEAQAASLLQALLRLPMDEGLRARAMERVDRLKDASGRVMFELALLQAEVGEGKVEAAKVVERLTGMDAVMMDALATLTDVVAELEKAAERDEANEPAYVRVIEAMGVLLQGLKTAKAATEALQAAVPRAPNDMATVVPLRVATGGSVVVVEVGAEGGSVTLIGRPGAGSAWQFARMTVDQSEWLLGEVEVELPGEPPLDSLEWVDGWEAALGLLDRYPWARLHPVEVHPEFRERMRVAVEERLADVDSESAERATEKWDRLLRQP